MIIHKKVCLLGDFAVGKSSLVRRYVEGRFDERYMSTIGVQIVRKIEVRPYGELHFILWDMTGTDNYRLRSSYLQGLGGAIIVCDMTRRETLVTLERYARQAREMNPDCRMVFIGNKMDLTAEIQLSEAEVREIAAYFAVPCWLTSAKTGEHVASAFLQMAEQLEARSSLI